MRNGSTLSMVPDAFGHLNEQSEFDLEESEFNNIDKNEQKEIYQFKLKIYENEERRIRDELHILEKEKVLYMQEFKRIYKGQKCITKGFCEINIARFARKDDHFRGRFL